MESADGKYHFVKKAYSTNDIKKCVLNTYNTYYYQCAELANLKGKTEYETCKNVFDFVCNNVTYRVDPIGAQWCKSPARLLSDGFGDCKSISIFCASALVACGVPCFFRFVSFGTKDVRHVYVVTYNGINVDPVEFFQNGRNFNEITTFSFFEDMPIKKGLAMLSGIGASVDSYNVWLGGKNFLENTRAANYIYVQIDLCFSLIRANGANIDALNKCDYYLAMLSVYNTASGNDAQMERAGHVLQRMANDGDFSLKNTSDDARIEHLEFVTQRANNLLSGSKVMDAYGDVYNEWNGEIMPNDYNGAGKIEFEALAKIKASESAIGDADADVLAKMKETAPYFLYLFVSDEWIAANKKKYPVINIKRKYENNCYKIWVDGFDTNLTENTIKNALRAGFVDRFKHTPEEVITERLSKNPKVGYIPIAEIVTIISLVATIASAVGAIVKSILNYCAAVKQAKAAEIMATADKYDEGKPAPDDFGDGVETSTNSGSGNFLLLGAASFLIYKFLKK